MAKYVSVNRKFKEVKWSNKPIKYFHIWHLRSNLNVNFLLIKMCIDNKSFEQLIVIVDK
jgi:hypothetical protein